MHIAIDGGTTNTRAVLVEGERVLGAAKRAVGVRDAVCASSGLPLLRAVEECIREVMTVARVGWSAVDGIAACGMLTSSIGMLELEHVVAPAGIKELARAVVSRAFLSLAPLPIRFVRGVRVDDDMMRGEECEVFGLLSAMKVRGPMRVLLPGSHSKWITVDANQRIVGIRTSMAGEFLAALSRHTILKGSLPESLPAEPNLDVVREGARLARFKGFFNAAFQTRIAEVLKKRSRDECAALLVGATYGGDLWELVQLGLWDDACPVMIAGSAPLKNLYVELARELAGERGLEMLDAPVEISQHAAAIGALKVAFFGKQAATMDFA